MNKEAWSFSCWKSFNTRLYTEALTPTDVMNNGAHEFHEELLRINNGVSMQMSVEPEEFRECIRVKKNNKKYLLPVKWEKDMPIKPLSTFKCQLGRSDKVIWEFITQPNIMSIKGEKYHDNFNAFLNAWNPMKHSRKEHWTLMKAIAFASKYKGLKMAVCSAPGTGKNSNFTIMNNISADISRIQKPTLPKLETIAYYNKVILPDEITSMAKSDVREMEPMILWLGDNSTEYNKHSMAQNSKLNTVDLTDKSVIFTYNRIQDLGNKSVFFDDKWDNIQAFRSRYPQLLLKGIIEEDMKNLSGKQAKKIMEDNFQDMRKIAKEYIYWTENMHKYVHGWKLNINLTTRHKTNLEALFDVLDVMSDTQEVFDYWVGLVKQAMDDYKSMLGGERE